MRNLTHGTDWARALTALPATLIAGLLFLVAASGCSSTQAPFDPGSDGFEGPAPGDFGVLFIGNSLTYTNNLPGMVALLLEHAGVDPIFVASSSYPNYGLQDHWVNSTTRAAISVGGWDAVIMQQGPSATEGRPSLLQYGEMFAEEIRAVGGEPGFYGVWPAQVRSFDFPGVSDSYATAAAQTGGLFFPVGDAWLAAWDMDESLPLYGPDAFHPSQMGTYLAAVVITQVLTGTPARSLATTVPGELGLLTAPEAVVAVLHEAASQAIESHQ